MEIPDQATYTEHHISCVVGDFPVSVTEADMLGPWTFRIGRFGCRDSETRGGVIQFFNEGRVFGGDSHYSFSGTWKLVGAEVRAVLWIDRHSDASACQELLGSAAEAFELDFSAVAITRDCFEGRSHRPGYPEFRAVIRRIE